MNYSFPCMHVKATEGIFMTYSSKAFKQGVTCLCLAISMIYEKCRYFTCPAQKVGFKERRVGILETAYSGLKLCFFHDLNYLATTINSTA